MSAVALIDSSPILVLPSVFALRQEAGTEPVRLDLLAPRHFRPAAERLAGILKARGIDARVPETGEGLQTLEEQVTAAWSEAPAQDSIERRVLDVSASTGGTASRAIAALERAEIKDYDLGWFCESTGLARFLSQSSRRSWELPVDIGSSPCTAAVTPAEFLAVLGLEERREEPYGSVPASLLLVPAHQLLTTYLADPRWKGPYGLFRRLLRPPGTQSQSRSAFREIPVDEVPIGMRPVLAALAQIDGWVETRDSVVRLAGPGDSAAVFFLSGGWLEIVVAEAVRRALPGRHVHMNLGTTWGYKTRTEAETDVTFVYDNCLYLLSCKNEAVHERLFSHLDRFRALVAEFGESRTRPVLLSTAQLERLHLERCATFEIGVIHGGALLRCLQDSLHDRPHALLEAVLGVSRLAPRAGLV